jgi:hypothetical protein
MCDYSLHHVKSRPAKVGDKLITTDFSCSVTRGFCPIEERGIAVCLQPGTEIAFERQVERRLNLFSLFQKRGSRKLPGKLARFRHINLDNPGMHHDALEFADGTIVLLTLLRLGQRAAVLQLPPQAHSQPPKDEVQRRDVITVS